MTVEQPVMQKAEDIYVVDVDSCTTTLNNTTNNNNNSDSSSHTKETEEIQANPISDDKSTNEDADGIETLSLRRRLTVFLG